MQDITNLQPFVAGERSPNQRIGGSPSLARKITLNLNALGADNGDGTAKYSPDELDAIFRNPKTSRARAIAANLLIAAMTSGFDKAQRIPKCLAAVNLILDRLEGKPTVTIKIEEPKRSEREIMADLHRLLPDMLKGSASLLRELVAADRQLADTLRQALNAIPVETTATVLPAQEPPAKKMDPGALPPYTEDSAIKDLNRARPRLLNRALGK